MKNQSLISNLRKLQAAQYRHDQAAHMDIASLPVPQRVTHFTLHFSKYVGQLAHAQRDDDDSLIQKVVTDSFVIALAAANAMNVDLQRRIEAGTCQADLAALDVEGKKTFEDVLLGYAEVVGKMAKACEAMDHMEDYPTRSTQERGVVLLVFIVRRLADFKGIDLAGATKARWRQIEQKPVAGKSEVVKDGTTLSRVA